MEMEPGADDAVSSPHLSLPRALDPRLCPHASLWSHPSDSPSSAETDGEAETSPNAPAYAYPSPTSAGRRQLAGSGASNARCARRCGAAAFQGRGGAGVRPGGRHGRTANEGSTANVAGDARNATASTT